MATVSCLIVNAVEEELASFPHGVVRQSKQMFAPPLYSYYNPYGAPIWIPTLVQGEVHPQSGLLFSGKLTEKHIIAIFRNSIFGYFVYIASYNFVFLNKSKADYKSALTDRAARNETISITPAATGIKDLLLFLKIDIS